MPQRSSWIMPGLTVLAALCGAGQAPAGNPILAVPHMMRLVYELRESKEEVRNLTGLGGRDKDMTLGALDEAIAQLKIGMKDMGFDSFPYIKPVDPDDYPPGEDHKHMRQALREMKAAKEELKAAKDLPADHRDAAIAALDMAAVKLQAALQTLSSAPPPRPADDPTTRLHLQAALYELRQVKEDVRGLNGLAERQREEILGALDEAILPMKLCLSDLGCTEQSHGYDPGPGADLARRLRRAVRNMNDARDELRAAKGVTCEHCQAALAAMDKVTELLQAALDALK